MKGDSRYSFAFHSIKDKGLYKKKEAGIKMQPRLNETLNLIFLITLYSSVMLSCFCANDSLLPKTNHLFNLKNLGCKTFIFISICQAVK